jgi:hypothetical protein
VDEHFDASNRKRSCEELAATRRRQTTPPSDELARSIEVRSLTITPDVMPGHYVARAVILDLQPTQMVPAIMATMDRIEEHYRFDMRTGWKACSDGLTMYFTAAGPQLAASQTREVA